MWISMWKGYKKVDGNGYVRGQGSKEDLEMV